MATTRAVAEPIPGLDGIASRRNLPG
jgi:hypothetical protein